MFLKGHKIYNLICSEVQHTRILRASTLVSSLLNLLYEFRRGFAR